jgi:hypothetical protein
MKWTVRSGRISAGGNTSVVSVARKESNTEATETLRGVCVELFEVQRARRNRFGYGDVPLERSP